MELKYLTPYWDYLGDRAQTIKNVCSAIIDAGGNICGGLPLSLFRHHSYYTFDGDIDVYPKTAAAKIDLVNLLFTSGYKLERISAAASTFNLPGQAENPFDHWYWAPDVQIVNITCEDPIEIIKEFDLSVCQFCLPSVNNLVGTTQAVEDSNECMMSIVNGWESPIELLFRVSKYYEKGYKLNPLQAIKLFAMIESEIMINEISAKKISNLQELVTVFRNTDPGQFNEIIHEMYKQFIARWKERLGKLQGKYNVY